MQYCDYEFYTGTFGGTAITEDAFPRLERAARATVDRITFGRLKKAGFASVENVPEEVKLAICAAAEYSLRTEANGGRTIASETTSKHSVTYGDTDSSAEAGMMRCAMSYLAGSKWTYRGVYPDEWHRHHHHHQCD